MSEPPLPLISISLVTFNGARWIESCLRSVRAQQYPRLELIVIDNASADATIGLTRAALAGWDAARLVCLPQNVGFGAAHNLGIEQSSGEFICLLNQDVVLEAGFVAATIGALLVDPTRGSAQGRLLRLSPDGSRLGTIDTTGLEIHRDRRITSRDQGVADAHCQRSEGSVFGVDGPVPVYRREALESVAYPIGGRREYLDEGFFLYHEDTDLAWRLHRFGWQAWYVPSAVAWHARGSSGPLGKSLLDLARYRRRMPRAMKILAWRNQRLMLINNEQLTDLRRDLVPVARRELGSFALLMINPSSLVAIPSLIRRLPRALRKRWYFQRSLGARRRERSIRGWLLGVEQPQSCDSG